MANSQDDKCSVKCILTLRPTCGFNGECYKMFDDVCDIKHYNTCLKKDGPGKYNH